MGFDQIFNYLESAGIIGLILILGSLIKVTPLQINIWKWFAKTIGNALTQDLLISVDQLKSKQKEIEGKLDKHIEEHEEHCALSLRKTILIFGREVLYDQKHTKEEFIEILSAIDDYEDYCEKHPDFPNNRCLFAIDLIKNSYRQRLEKADFLAESERCKLERGID